MNQPLFFTTHSFKYLKRNYSRERVKQKQSDWNNTKKNNKDDDRKNDKKRLERAIVHYAINSRILGAEGGGGGEGERRMREVEGERDGKEEEGGGGGGGEGKNNSRAVASEQIK